MFEQSRTNRAGHASSAGERPAHVPVREQRWLVHVGLHKTATSWLQTHLFGNREHGFVTAGNPGMSAKQRAKALAHRFYLDERDRLIGDLDFDADALSRDLSEIPVPPGSVPVLSSERLGGHPFSNGFDRQAICQRIAQVLPDALILMVVREQKSMMVSNYMQYLKYGGWQSLENYLDGPSDARQPRLTLEYWCYDRLIRLYQAAFGPERLLVLPYELFVREPEDFIRRICEFAGVPAIEGLPTARVENARRGHFASCTLRWLGCFARQSAANGYFPPAGHPLAARVIDGAIRRTLSRIVPAGMERRAKANLDRRAAQLAGDRFAQSNKATSELIGIDLGTFGYDVGS